MTKVMTVPGEQFVYNLEVHRDHVYYVSNLAVLVHNACEFFPNPKDALGIGGQDAVMVPRSEVKERNPALAVQGFTLKRIYKMPWGEFKHLFYKPGSGWSLPAPQVTRSNMRIINIKTSANSSDFFQRAEDAIAHGLGNERARRVRDDLPALKGARVLGGRCDFDAVTFVLSNGVNLRFLVHDNIADWRVGPSDGNSLQPQPALSPILIRSEFGEYPFDASRLLATCIGREVVSMGADLSHAQLLLNDLPLAFFACRVQDTDEPFLQWCDTREEEEIATEANVAS